MSLVSLVCVFMRVVVITFYPPTLAVKLELSFGFDSDQAAYFYSLETAFAFVTNLVLIFFPITSHAQQWNACALLGTIVGVFLMGPSALLLLPSNIYIMGVGTALMGTFAQVLSISSVVCCAESMQQLFPGEDEQISRILGSYRVSLAGLALAVSPFFASIIQQVFSYSVLCDTIASILGVVLAGFIWVWCSEQRKTWKKRDSALTEPLLEEMAE